MSFESKRKRGHGHAEPTKGVDTSKPTAVFQPQGGRSWTLSVAVPGSIIANAQSHDLKTTLAGQIARALAVFCVDEVIIFDDGQGHLKSRNRSHGHTSPVQPDERTYTGDSDPNHFLTHILSYLETPPYLRKHLFPLHPNLRTAGTLPSLDMPHHLRADEWCQYREGVTIDDDSQPAPVKGSKKDRPKRKDPSASSPPKRTLVDAGLRTKIILNDISIPPKTRVSLKFPDDHPYQQHNNHKVATNTTTSTTSETYIPATAVRPDTPREEAGYYWGYTIRRAPSLSTIFTESPYDGGYDLSIGTSERGVPLSSIPSPSSPSPPYRHLLIVFGGLAGLEAALLADPDLSSCLLHVHALFDYYVNLCCYPDQQGSRTVRTEEAVWIGCPAVRRWFLGC